MASWSRRRATPRKPAMVTAVAIKGNEEATVASSVAPSEAEGAVVHNHNNMASMILQASELATVEADGNADSTTLGDMEITLRAMKPSLVPTTPPSLHTDLRFAWRRSNVLQTLSRNDVDVDSSPAAVGVGQGELTTYESVKMLPLQQSPTSQFEYDILNATHPTLDFVALQKSYSHALLDDDDKSISSEESLRDDDGDSFISDSTSVNNNVKDAESYFVQNIISPMDCAADYMFCKLRCAFPNAVEDANEIMTTNLHHFMFKEGEEDAKEEVGALALQNDEARDNRLEEVGPGEEGAGEQEEDEDEDGEEIVVDEQEDSLEVNVVLGRYVQMQDQLEKATYSPGKGFVLSKDGKLPELSEDEVLIRVDATAISTRDCLERLRRDTNEDLKDDVWVPGHEIVGHVVRAGAGIDAKYLLDKRIAAVLPYGGGCSQYVCIHANDAIALPEEAGSNEVVALLSTYMTAYQCLESVATKEDEDDESKVGEDDESKVGEDDAEAEASPSNKDDAEQKRSHLCGKNVLIIDSGSPVGHALVDLATNAGATVHTVPHLISHFNAIQWRGGMDLIVDLVGDSDNNPSFYKIMKTRARLVRVNITSCEKKYVPLTGMIEGEKDTSYYGRVMNDKAIDFDIFHSFNDDREVFTEDLTYLHDLCQTGTIEPKIFSQVGFDQLEGEWENLMVEGGNGVIVVSPWKLGFTTVNS